jgi:hypothetical protein
VSNQKASVNNIQSELCSALNTNRTRSDVAGNSLKVVAKWDDATQKCIMMEYESSDTNCPLNQIFKGYKADGSIECQATPGYAPTPETTKDSDIKNGGCSGGATVVIELDGKATIQCL